MREDEESLFDRLSQIGRERESLEDSFRATRQKIEEMDEQLIQNNQKLSYRIQEELDTNCDSQLLEIYQEREDIYKDMRVNTQKFDEEYQMEYERKLQSLDDEEASIKESLYKEEE
jgi:hypothetical protein